MPQRQSRLSGSFRNADNAPAHPKSQCNSADRPSSSTSILSIAAAADSPSSSAAAAILVWMTYFAPICGSSFIAKTGCRHPFCPAPDLPSIGGADFPFDIRSDIGDRDMTQFIFHRILYPPQLFVHSRMNVPANGTLDIRILMEVGFRLLSAAPSSFPAVGSVCSGIWRAPCIFPFVSSRY